MSNKNANNVVKSKDATSYDLSKCVTVDWKTFRNPSTGKLDGANAEIKRLSARLSESNETILSLQQQLKRRDKAEAADVAELNGRIKKLESCLQDENDKTNIGYMLAKAEDKAACEGLLKRIEALRDGLEFYDPRNLDAWGVYAEDYGKASIEALKADDEAAQLKE